MLKKIAEKGEKIQQIRAKHGKERYEKNYVKSIIHLPRHCDEVTCESAVVWAKTGETLAVGAVGDYA